RHSPRVWAAHCVFAILLASGTHIASLPSSLRRGRCRRRRSSARPEMPRPPFFLRTARDDASTDAPVLNCIREICRCSDISTAT
uniref:Uncharacterized protein n=1 Tax=Aegilops tauschii subsp. strangulata TaxID=200361 RepID=A0A453RJJ4_AEGTS